MKIVFKFLPILGATVPLSDYEAIENKYRDIEKKYNEAVKELERIKKLQITYQGGMK